MFRSLQQAALTMVITIISLSSFSQDYTFEDFVGTWHGSISSSYFGGFNDPMTMVIYADGFYTETSGHLMPTIYPNTQQCEYQASTNRFHWWYLYLVYAGQQTFQHHYYTVVHFQNDTLIMHYNFWNDPEPYPDAGTIFLVKENMTPPPTNLSPDFSNNEVQLTWQAPDYVGNPLAELQGYNVYESYESGDYELLNFTTETYFLIEDTISAGHYGYYVTAVYTTGESLPSNELIILYATPEPEALQGIAQANSVALEWAEPNPENGAMATLQGYNIFHKYENGSFLFAEFTESTSFIHENLDSGSHYYYVTAVYSGGESDPSNEIEVSLFSVSSGDANCDGMIDVLDVIAIVNEILGNNPNPFCFENADVDGNGTINVLDVTATINIIAGGKATSVNGLNSASTHIYLNRNNITLDSDGTLTALQFDLKGDGIDYPRLSLNLPFHEMAFVKEAGLMRVLIFSMDNTPIPAGKIEIVRFDDPTEELPHWAEVIAANLNANEVQILKYRKVSSTLNNPAETAKVTVYPNPAQNFVFVDASAEIQNLRINNYSGQVIKSFETLNIHQKLDISDIPAGIYFISFKTNHGTVSEKLIKR
jgi:hypothetical protein